MRDFMGSPHKKVDKKSPVYHSTSSGVIFSENEHTTGVSKHTDILWKPTVSGIGLCRMYCLACRICSEPNSIPYRSHVIEPP